MKRMDRKCILTGWVILGNTEAPYLEIQLRFIWNMCVYRNHPTIVEFSASESLQLDMKARSFGRRTQPQHHGMPVHGFQ